MEWIIANQDGLLLAITGVISAAAAIAALTPTPKDDSILAKIRKVVDLFALNFLNAKNQDK